MAAKPRTIGQYLAPLSREKRAALQQLRRAIKSAAPGAEECISYGIPGFRLGGRLLVSFGAAANHCAFYPGAHPVAAHRAQLRAYGTSKGSIRFDPAHPLPATLVRRLVQTRIREYAGRSAPAPRRAGGVIDAYLAPLPASQRAALARLRKTIRAAAPGAEECIRYRLPAFRLNGSILVCFGARTSHCAMYPMSGAIVKAHRRALANFDTSAGTVRFQPSSPIPAALVRRLVKARIAETSR